MDAFITSLGRRPCDDWHAIDRWVAESVLEVVLQCGLAYSNTCMSAEQAERFAQEFLGLFDDGCCFFATGDTDDEEKNGLGSRGGITDATFDKGVVVVDGLRVGMLWVSDED